MDDLEQMASEIFREKLSTTRILSANVCAMFPCQRFFSARYMYGFAGAGVALLLSIAGMARAVGAASVVISEIHYHPVEESAFNSDGTPTTTSS